MADFDAVFDAAIAKADTGASDTTTSTENSGGDEAVVLDTGAEEVTEADPVVDDEAPPEVSDEEAVEVDAGEPVAVKAAPKEVPVDPDLPEGATVETGKDGKKYYRFEQARGAGVYAGYKQAQMIRESLGVEALDENRIKLMVSDHQYLVDMDRNMARGEAEQEKVLRFWLKTGAEAYENGAVDQDPHQHTANAILKAAKTVAPKVYENLRASIATESNQKLVDDLYTAATRAGLNTPEGKNLLGTAQRLDAHLSKKFRAAEELLKGAPPVDPSDARLKEIETREANLRRRDEAEKEARFNGWVDTVKTDRRATTDTVIGETLKPFEESLKTLSGPLQQQGQEHLKTLRVRLEREIGEALAKDPNWGKRVGPIFEDARVAKAEQFRDTYRRQLNDIYAAQVRNILRQVAGPIISATTGVITEASKKTHERLANSQNQKPAVGQGAAPKPQIPKSNGKLSFEQIDARIDKLLSTTR